MRRRRWSRGGIELDADWSARRLGQGKRMAKGLGKGMAKGFAKGRKHLGTATTLDVVLETSREDMRDMYGFTVRPQHLERYLEFSKIYEAEEVERSNCWKKFLHSYSNPNDSEDKFGNGDGRAETVIDEVESDLGSLSAVVQSLHKVWKTGKTEDSKLGDDVSGAGNGGGPDSGKSEVCPWAEELKKLVRDGVPVDLRGELWQVFAGAKERWEDGYYQKLLGRDAKLVKASAESLEDNLPPFKARPLEKWASQIEKDLPRTFPGHPKLGKDGIDALRRMLTAYARHNPSVGYCQAMNFLAALLLLLMPEENAFWTLTSMIDNYFEGYYTEKMSEAQVDQLVFTELVREQFPKLATHLDTVDVEISWFSGSWFLSIFVNVLPWESVLRVWDVLLFEGNRRMLFQTALALVEMNAVALVQQQDNGVVLAMLQSMGETTFDSSQLVLSACLGFHLIDEKRLQSLRNQHRPTVIAALHQRSLDLRQWRATTAMAEQAITDASSGSMSALAPPNTAENDERSSSEPQLSAPKGLNLAEDEDRSLFEHQLSAPKFYTLDPILSNRMCFKSGTFSQIHETCEYVETQSFDLQEEVSRLRKELDYELQAREEAECRAEGLKHALIEMEKVDHRRQFSAEVEELEVQVAHLKQALADKDDQEAATVQVLVRLEQESRNAEYARQRTVEEAEANRKIANKALMRTAEELEAMKKRAVTAERTLEAMEKRAVLAESMLDAIDKRAAEELAAMEKRAKMAESMLEATLEFHSGATPRTKLGMEPKLKGDDSRDNSRFRHHTIPKQDGDSAWEKRQNASKLEEAEELPRFTGNKTTLLGRPFPLRDKSKVHVEHKEDDVLNHEIQGSTSVSQNSPLASIGKTGNLQYSSTAPELVKLHCIKRRL